MILWFVPKAAELKSAGIAIVVRWILVETAWGR
jgi:hypothetical protein